MCLCVSLKLAGNANCLLPAADLQEFAIVVGCWGFLRTREGSRGLVCWFFFPNQALQLCLDSVLAEASSLPVCVHYSIPEYVDGMVLAVPVI